MLIYAMDSAVMCWCLAVWCCVSGQHSVSVSIVLYCNARSADRLQLISCQFRERGSRYKAYGGCPIILKTMDHRAPTHDDKLMPLIIHNLSLLHLQGQHLFDDDFVY